MAADLDRHEGMIGDDLVLLWCLEGVQERPEVLGPLRQWLETVAPSATFPNCAARASGGQAESRRPERAHGVLDELQHVPALLDLV